jgi:hypothetical protein
MVVDCFVTSGPDEPEQFVGRVRGHVSGGWFGGDPRGAAQAVGRAIAERLVASPDS